MMPVAGVKVSILVWMVAVALGAVPACADDRPSTASLPVPGGEAIPYPEEWRTSLSDVQARADFLVIVPNDSAAGPDNVVSVYLWPDGTAVALQFPPPASPQSPIRQEYIEVWESPWPGGDPLADYERDLAEAPSESKALYDIAGVVALGVEAHSPSDMEGANPVFLRFVIDGIEVQVSGGEDLDLLIRIAETIVRSAQGGAEPSP